MGSLSSPRAILYLVRHAQGYHNLSFANHVMHDPELTAFGITQCDNLFKSFPYHDRITHLLASPLKRTLATCLLSFRTEVTDKRLKVICVPELQETAAVPCDTGSDREILAAELDTHEGLWKGFGNENVDLSLVIDGWNSKTGKWDDKASSIEARAKVARIYIRDLVQKYQAETPGTDVEMAIVTHGGFLHFFTEDWDGFQEAQGTGWYNTEWRSYEFADDTDFTASLKETNESITHRKGTEHPLTNDEVRELESVQK